MATDVGSRTKSVTAISLAQLGREFLAYSRARWKSNRLYATKTQALRILGSMGDVNSSVDLVFTPEFLARFVEAWGGSIRKDTVREMMDALGDLRDFAASHHYLAPSGSEGRPLPMPASFVGPLRPIIKGNRTTTPAEIDALAAILKHYSGPWLGARLFALFATLMLARPKNPTDPDLSLEEAVHVRKEDIDLEAGSIRIRSRAGKWHRGIDEFIYFGDVLREILARWLPRTCCEWAFPDQRREAPWRNSRNPGRNRFLAWVRDACGVLGNPLITVSALIEFGREDAERLSDPVRSPFLIAHDGPELTVKNIPISELRDTIECHLSLGREFQFIEAALGTAAMTLDLTPQVIPKIEALMREADPDKEMRPYVKRHLNVIFCDAIRRGFLDEYPFAGRHKFVLKGRWPGLCLPVRAKPKRPYREPAAGRIAISSQAEPPGRRCPVELRGDGRPILMGKEVLPGIKGDAYKMLEHLVDGFDQGRRIPAFELGAFSASGRIRPLTHALDRPGFELLARLIHESKEGRNKFLEILDIGPGD